MPEPPVTSACVRARAAPRATEVGVGDRVGDDQPPPGRRLGGSAAAHRRRRRRAAPRAAGGRPARRVWRASQRRRSGSVIGVSGWRSMPALAEQPVADEEMALVDRCARCPGRPGRPATSSRAERVEQRLGDRADVAGGGRIEGRAVLEEDLPAALGAQPAERGERLRDRLGGRDRARLERDDGGVGAAASAPAAGHAERSWTVRIPPGPACWRGRWRR